MEQTSGFIRTEREMADHLDNGAVGLHWVSADGIILWANRADYEPLGGFDHGVGHSILVLCDTKAHHGKKCNDFNPLENYHFNTSMSLF